MSTLVIQLPERQRLRARRRRRRRRRPPRAGASTSTSPAPTASRSKRRATPRAALLPTRSIVIAVVQRGRRQLASHHLAEGAGVAPAHGARRRARRSAARRRRDRPPRASRRSPSPASRPGSRRSTGPGSQDELAALQKAGVFVDRVVPMAWPDDPPAGHFHAPSSGVGTRRRRRRSPGPACDGVATVRLDGGLARALVPQPAPPTTRWTAAPMAAAAAERWLGAPVNVMPTEQRLLQAGRSLWNLRQFDLARRTRGARALGDWAAPGDEPGVAAGAHRPRRCSSRRRSSASTSGPGTRRARSRRAAPRSRRWSRRPSRASPTATCSAIAAAVMLRETQALRTLAGKPGDSDLEPMLQAAAAAWPGERPPVETVRFEAGKLTPRGERLERRADRAVPRRAAAGRRSRRRQRRPPDR